MLRGVGLTRKRARERLDERLLREGLADTRSRAQGLIRAGVVLVDDVPVDKPGTPVAESCTLRLRGEPRRYVSRGGDKLAGALIDLQLEPEGLCCLDVGASSGGFTDCLLQAGAVHVTAVDVGYGQLDLRLRDDPRVTVLERRNARTLEASELPHPPELVVVDVSFISLTLILPRIAAIAPAAELVVLVKPQFEVGRAQVGKGGVVRDDALRAQAVERVAGCARELGYGVSPPVDSRLAGPKGNREIFLRLSRAGVQDPAEP